MTDVLQTLTFDAYTAYLAIVRETLPEVAVYDGPQPQLPTKKSFVVVGANDVEAPPGSLLPAVDLGTQDWDSIGAATHSETFRIWAVVVAFTGRNDLAFCRNLASSYVEAIGDAVRQAPRGTGDAMLGGVLNQDGAGTGWCTYTPVTAIQQRQDSTGCQVHVQTALDCFVRI